MAKLVKGTKRYVLLRGKDETGSDIVIDFFDKKTLDQALKESRIDPQDHVVQVQVLGKVSLKKPDNAKT